MNTGKSQSQIILVYPKTGWDIKNVSTLLPLSVLYLVRPLKEAGFKVRIIDQRNDPRWENELKHATSSPDTIAVGISAMTGLQIGWGLSAARIVRVSGEAKIVWGGIHPTLLTKQTLADPFVDVVALNEGENTAPALFKALAESKSLKDVPGVAFTENDETVMTDKPDPADLDRWLIPDYDAVPVQDYFTTQTLGLKDLAITTSRGCPNRCRYCYNIPYSGRRWRAQSADGVLEHIALIQKRFGVKGILVKDDNFFVDKKRVEQIADGFTSLDIQPTVRAECRADYIADKWEPEFLERIAAAGFREMTVGAESGSDRTLETICKDVTVDQIRRANKLLRKAKIATKFTFMTGYPGETKEDVKATLALMLELVRENPYARVTPLHLYAPYPGTELYDESVTQGYEPPDSLKGWAGVSFHELNLPWIPKKLGRLLENASVATYFLDGRTVPEYFSNSPLMKILAKIYGAVVRLRAKRFFFRFMPELSLLEWVRKRKKMVG